MPGLAIPLQTCPNLSPVPATPAHPTTPANPPPPGLAHLPAQKNAAPTKGSPAHPSTLPGQGAPTNPAASTNPVQSGQPFNQDDYVIEYRVIQGHCVQRFVPKKK